MRILALALVAVLTACTPAQPNMPASAPNPVIRAAMTEEPSVEAVEAAQPTLAAAVQDAIASVAAEAPPEPTAPPVAPLVAAPAVSLIVRWEVGNEKRYARRYTGVVCPGGASGPTIGIGYDLGYQTVVGVLADWADHEDRARLSQAAGTRGSRCIPALSGLRGIVTPYRLAESVFRDRTLVEYERRTRRAFSPGYDLLRPLAKGALVSLVYNRGAAMSGDSRREMRDIKDCTPEKDYACIAKAIRDMKRLWRGSSIEAGMVARREAEAILVETL